MYNNISDVYTVKSEEIEPRYTYTIKLSKILWKTLEKREIMVLLSFQLRSLSSKRFKHDHSYKHKTWLWNSGRLCNSLPVFAMYWQMVFLEKSGYVQLLETHNLIYINHFHWQNVKHSPLQWMNFLLKQFSPVQVSRHVEVCFHCVLKRMIYFPP
jgi:hypothetical protein